MSQTDPSPGIGTLIGGLASDIQHLVRGEIALARTELDQKISKATASLSPIMAGAIFAFGGFVVVLMAFGYGLAFFMPTWLAFLIVGVIAVVVGGIITSSGVRRLKSVDPMPAQTAKNLQKDADMLKGHL